MASTTVHATAILGLLCGIAAAALPAEAPAQGAPLIVEVRSVPSNEGMVRVDVCTAATFLKTTCAVSAEAPAAAGTTSVVVDALPEGVYAVQAYHDRHNLGHVERGALGIPKVGVGFSNDAPIGLKGPSFARASFVHGAATQTITLKLRHFGGRGSAAPAPAQ